MTEEPETIWLAPRCCTDPDTGRMWACDPSPWPCPSCEENGFPVKYIRADLVMSTDDAIVDNVLVNTK